MDKKGSNFDIKYLYSNKIADAVRTNESKSFFTLDALLEIEW